MKQKTEVYWALAIMLIDSTPHTDRQQMVDIHPVKLGFQVVGYSPQEWRCRRKRVEGSFGQIWFLGRRGETDSAFPGAPIYAWVSRLSPGTHAKPPFAVLLALSFFGDMIKKSPRAAPRPPPLVGGELFRSTLQRTKTLWLSEVGRLPPRQTPRKPGGFPSA